MAQSSAEIYFAGNSTRMMINITAQKSELRIREGIEDNSKIIFLISKQKHNVVTPH